MRGHKNKRFYQTFVDKLSIKNYQQGIAYQILENSNGFKILVHVIHIKLNTNSLCNSLSGDTVLDLSKLTAFAGDKSASNESIFP